MLHQRTIREAERLTLPITVLAVAVLGLNVGVGQTAQQAGVAKAVNSDYSVVHGWPVLPETAIFEEVSSVAVNSQGNVLVLQRGGRTWPDSDVLDQTLIPVPTVFVFDGQATRHMGRKLFALPHSVTVLVSFGGHERQTSSPSFDSDEWSSTRSFAEGNR